MKRFLLGTGALGIALSQGLIYCYAPVEATMGLSQKIFYTHLPLAWWGLVAFFLVFVCSLLGLRRRKRSYALFARASGEIGELFAILTLATGMLWGRAAWGVWWTWDPRLTTALVLCFIYAGWLLLHTLDFSEEKKQLVCAVTGIIAFLDVPLVFLSSRLWRSIHPAVFTQSGIGLGQEMLITLVASLIAYGVFFVGLLMLRYDGLQLAQRVLDVTRDSQENR